MTTEGTAADPARGLRLRAEARLKAQDAATVDLPRPAPGSVRQLHELQVHQIELELQNEELRGARAEVEEVLARFTDLYDFSPVGYFTLRRDGVIVQTNLAGAKLLGLERALLQGKRFASFVPASDRSGFDDFMRHIFSAVATPVCEVGLVGRNGGPRIVRIEGVLSTDGQECRAVVMDVTDRRQAEKENCRLNAELEERVRQRTATIRTLATEIALAEQRERLRISHVLHEDLQQLIVGAKFLLQAVRATTAAGRAQLKEVDSILSSGVDVTRMLAVDLSPPILHDADFGAVLHWLGNWMGENHALVVQVTVPAAGRGPMPEVLSVILYQSVRELLFNVVKHAKVKTAAVAMDWVKGEVRIVVSDEGEGFDAAASQAGSGLSGTFGLFSVRERLALWDGRVEIESAPGKGCRITLQVAPPQVGVGP